MGYKILDGKEWELKKVTPKAVRLYQNMIMESADNQDKLEESGNLGDALRASVKTLNIFLEPESMMPWADVVFDMGNDRELLIKAIKEDDYDYEEYVKGFQDFLAKLSPLVS